MIWLLLSCVQERPSSALWESGEELVQPCVLESGEITEESPEMAQADALFESASTLQVNPNWSADLPALSGAESLSIEILERLGTGVYLSREGPGCESSVRVPVLAQVSFGSELLFEAELELSGSPESPRFSGTASASIEEPLQSEVNLRSNLLYGPPMWERDRITFLFLLLDGEQDQGQVSLQVLLYRGEDNVPRDLAEGRW